MNNRRRNLTYKDQESRRFSLIVIALVLVFSMTVILFVTQSDSKDTQQKVAVLSKMGCIVLDQTPEEFEAKQKFRQDILHYQLVRCK